MPRTKTAVKRTKAETTKATTARPKVPKPKAAQSKSSTQKAATPKAAKLKTKKLKEAKSPIIKPKAARPRAAEPLTPEQQQEQRSQAARKAALARWSKERPPSKRELRQQLSRVPSSDLTVEHYADRANPELSWAAAILKRGRSGENQRKKAAEIMSRYGVPKSRGKLAAYLKALPPEQRHEIAQRAGRRRWEIWREEQARLQGRDNFRSAR
jgi:hypothetical protein